MGERRVEARRQGNGSSRLRLSPFSFHLSRAAGPPSSPRGVSSLPPPPSGGGSILTGLPYYNALLRDLLSIFYCLLSRISGSVGLLKKSPLGPSIRLGLLSCDMAPATRGERSLSYSLDCEEATVRPECGAFAYPAKQ